MALDFLIYESFLFEHSTITTTSPTTSTTVLVLSYSYYYPTLTTTILIYYCLFETICGGLLLFWFDLWLTVILLLLLMYSYSTTTLSTTTIYYYYNLSNTYACIWKIQWWTFKPLCLGRSSCFFWHLSMFVKQLLLFPQLLPSLSSPLLCFVDDEIV
jgi:hypothetical protein